MKETIQLLGTPMTMETERLDWARATRLGPTWPQWFHKNTIGQRNTKINWEKEMFFSIFFDVDLWIPFQSHDLHTPTICQFNGLKSSRLGYARRLAGGSEPW